MKKMIYVMALVINIILLTGCTDESKKFEERIETENEINSESLGDKDEEPERD